MTSITSSAAEGRRNVVINGVEFESLLQNLSDKWDLALHNPRCPDSPSRRQQAVAGTDLELANNCIERLRYLFFSQRRSNVGFFLHNLLDDFDTAANRLLPGWTRDQRAGSRLARPPRKLTITERRTLQKCLFDTITPKFHEARRLGRDTRSMSRSLSDTTNIEEPAPTPAKSTCPYLAVDDRPISLDIGKTTPSTRHKKRNSEDFEFEDARTDQEEQFKRPRLPREKSPLHEINTVIDDVLTRTQNPKFKDLPQTKASKEQSAPRHMGTTSASHFPPKDKSFDTADTSFVSEVSSVFSLPPKKNDSVLAGSFTSTQTTIQTNFGDLDEDEIDLRISMIQPMEEQRPPTSSTHYGSTVAEEDLDSSALKYLRASFLDGSSTEKRIPTPPSNGDPVRYPELPGVHQPLKRLENSLGDIFPRLPRGLVEAPLAVRYEVTRVFLHCNADILKYVWPSSKQLENYESLWKHLKGLAPLKGKVFPQKSDEKAWKAALKDYKFGNQGVVMKGSFKYDHATTNGPLFNFGLEPLSIDKTHRFGRRFGNDRFFEVSLPSLTGPKTPSVLKAAGDEGFQLLIQWLVENTHKFLGRDWQAFFTKNSRSRKSVSILDEVEKTPASQTIYLFAVTGEDFDSRQSTGKTKLFPRKDEPLDRHTELSVEGLVHWMIPINLNKGQPALKLFSRISLGLSKTIPTCVVSRIIEHKKNLVSKTGEVMNDGCGRMSYEMAKAVAQQLGLSNIPSAFQARIGPAKGLWVVNSTKDSKEGIWIETYPSQRKWIRANTIFDEEDLRTFEVNGYSRTLCSADLNLQFLPILESRASDPSKMRKALSIQLENGLNYRISLQKAAMDDPKALRKWAKEINPGIDERLALGHVSYQGSFPKGAEEEINMLVDSGFHPRKTPILKDLTTKMYHRECEILKRKLNITVGQSTYAYMAVDFTGILAPDEVHIGFSNTFRDDESGFSGVILNDMDVLVARSPAHLISDIQKVKAVWKPELYYLNDVILFPSTGPISLASKLSGGDYDGDKAWICWDAQIVRLFENAPVPKCPDLVANKWMEQDKTTYAKIIDIDSANSFSTFLTKSFAFNMQENLLGICTSFKEEFCYTFNEVDSDNAVFLSTLLSNLVDQAKQGFVFNFEHLAIVKRTLLHRRPLKTPQYKSDRWDGQRSHIRHIVDDLKFNIAENVVSETLEDFHKQFPPDSREFVDPDLLQPYKWFKKLAKSNPNAKTILEKLEADLKLTYTAWKEKTPKDMGFGPPSAKGHTYTDLVQDVHGRFMAITPAPTNITELIFPKWQVKDGLSVYPEYGFWPLLRASTAYWLNKLGIYIWRMAGKQLCALKASAGEGGEEGATVMKDTMYVMLKPDNTFVKRFLNVGRGEEEDDVPIEEEDD